MIKHAWRNKAIEAGQICRICHEPIPDKKWAEAQKNGQRCEGCMYNRRNELERKRSYEEWERKKIQDGR